MSKRGARASTTDAGDRGAADGLADRAGKRQRGAAGTTADDVAPDAETTSPPRAPAAPRLWSPAAAAARQTASDSEATDAERAEQLAAASLAAEKRARFLASPHARRTAADGQRQEERIPDEIRVGDDYQVDVPRYQPARGKVPESAREGELVHGGVLAAIGASKPAQPRAGRDVQRKPTPGAKKRVGADSPGSSLAPEPTPPEEEFRGFAFPLPASGPPTASQERWLGWQLLKLGWSRKREMPLELLAEPPREWSAAERSAFTKAKATHGKHFREMLPALPGRSLDELIERYYTSKAHKRLAQVDAEQTTRNVRQGPCGTMGCLLHDNHAGPHQFSAPMGKRERKPKIKGEND